MSFSRTSLGSHDRKLRYRALLDDLSNLDIEGANNDERMEKTSNAVREAQSLLAEGGVEERVRHPGEGYLDSRVVRATSDLAVRCSIAVSGNANNYDRHELAQHIRENPDMWDFPLPREVPVCAFLLGTFDPTPPEERPRVTRRRAERQQTAALATPENVQKLDKTEEGSEMVSRVNRFITKAYRNNGDRPLSYFHTVLDPTSFARSVENIYYVSFLARDQLISLNIDEEVGLPFIKPVPVSDREQDERGLADENQFLVSLDMQRWKTNHGASSILFVDELKQTLKKYLFGICPQGYKIPMISRDKNFTFPPCDLDLDQQELAARLASLALRVHSTRGECPQLSLALASTFSELARTAAERQQAYGNNASINENKKRKLSKSQKAKLQAKQRTALAVKKKAAALAAAAAAKVSS